MSGIFIAVVGPSGVGKDTLLDHARLQLIEDDRFVFPRRVVTRHPQAGGEIFDSLSRIEFDAWDQAGSFSLSWRAHGLGYGLRRNVLGAVEDGRCVVANVSRSVLPDLPGIFGEVRIVHVTAPPAVLASRLAARGREVGPEMDSRIARFETTLPTTSPVMTIDNSGPIEIAQAAFLDALIAAAAEVRSVQPA
ncbi:ribose 1,5-bisphosphokinase [Rhodoligotrophos appendicifer]|uniref:phosphonate metabolism protein/1,5-bisphosphokinase (PRPP-forming) PhnN n=1 Tax=Rhodoligotrophos appendicifer TaxID=987056 RepID=UPI00117F952D|nr:phosphonate metabolism protein/1,5-bisphosphokinase (PRPP-forming) PhnN [Rhodoligotrophos appendicifer]